MELLFATSNQNKVREINEMAAPYKIEFKQVNLLYPEIRVESVGEVAEAGAKHVFSQINRQIIVEDSGLFIDALNGFPGPYSGWVFHKIGLQGILNLLGDSENRSARFVSAIGYADKNTVKVFEGVIEGEITANPAGSKGFGYDPIFKPEGSMKTFAQDIKNKNHISHRRQATEQLIQFLTKE